MMIKLNDDKVLFIAIFVVDDDVVKICQTDFKSFFMLEKRENMYICDEESE